MSDVLLIYPPYAWEMKHPPIGLAYIAAVLEQSKHSVAICDMNPLQLKLEDIPAVVKEHSPGVIGISSMTPQIPVVHHIAQIAKSVDPSVSVVVGGPHVSALPKETLQQYPAIDFVAVGEGERLMPELVTTLMERASIFRHIGGLAYRENGEVVVNPAPAAPVDIESLPFPAWHLLPMNRYSVPGYGGRMGERTQVMLTSRGCPYQCIFCDSHSVFGRSFRSRSPENIIEEMRFLNQEYGITQFDFADDMITVNRKWLSSLCTAMIEQGIPGKIRWMANARVNTVDLDLLRLLRQAGCVRVDFGVESGDPKVLKAIKKNITVEQAIAAHRWAKEAGLTVGTFFMVGNISEDAESAKKTVALARAIKTDFPSVGIATPFPGSELYEVATANGWLTSTDWSLYDTSPRLQGRSYRPLLRTEHMSQEDILKAFHYVSTNLLQMSLRSKYGRWFFLNPALYRDKRVFRRGSLSVSLYRLGLAARMIRRLA